MYGKTQRAGGGRMIAMFVNQMVEATPNARGPLFVDTTHRYGGYQYVIDNPKILSAFFEQHLPE